MKTILRHILIVLIISAISFLPWIYNRYRISKNKNTIFTNGKAPLVSSCPKCRISIKRPEWIKIKTLDKF